MSSVGTRPPTIDEYENYETLHKRMGIRRGITGPWQVSGRNDVTGFEVEGELALNKQKIDIDWL